MNVGMVELTPYPHKTGPNEIEANDATLETEACEWVNSSLVDDDDAGFDAEVFERKFNEAKTLRKRETQCRTRLFKADGKS